jgi:hypothetical protein
MHARPLHHPLPLRICAGRERKETLLNKDGQQLLEKMRMTLTDMYV